jgi:hypothetical protein
MSEKASTHEPLPAELGERLRELRGRLDEFRRRL